MTPKPKTKTETEKPKEQKHMCDVCGDPAVVQHDAHFYCQPHYSIRLESVSHEQVVERHKKGDNKPRALAG